MFNSRIDKNLPLIKIQQNTNMAIPLNKKLYFSVYGNYTLDKKRSVILPATSTLSGVHKNISEPTR